MYWSVEGQRDQTRVENVRTALANLAMALSASEEWQEARRHLERALAAPGESPATWQLLTELGRVSERQGDRVGALEDFLHALVVTPPEFSAEPAELAMRQLEQDGGAWLAKSADNRLYERLLLQTGSNGGDEAVAKVAARLATLRGDLHKAGEIAGETPGSDTRDSAWNTAITASSVLAMLEDFRFADSLAELDAMEGEDANALAYLRALALYGLERDLEAIEICSLLEPKPDLCVAQSISYLALAASTVGADRLALLERARDAAAMAARLDSGNPAPSLARAQVLLEGDLDLREGRRLLKRVVRLLGDDVDPTSLYVWRLQARRRGDEFFAVFDIELAHALGRADSVVSRAGSMALTSTSHRQDGAVRQRLAAALVDRGEVDEAVKTYGMAADSFAFAEDVEMERRCLDRLLDLRFSVRTALRLTERVWQSSPDKPVRDSGKHLERINGGALALRRLETWLADARDDEGIADNEVALANLLDGLLVHRRQQLSGDIADTELWPGLVSALMAPQLVPEESYYAGHVAVMLSECSLHNAAHHFALRAHENFPEDEWLQSTFISCQANWRGMLDERAAALLDNFRESDPTWAAALDTWQLALSGNAARTSSDLPDVDTNALWVQQIRAYGIALRDGMDAARPHLEDLAKQAISEREYGVAARTCLRIDLNRVDELLALARADHVLPPRRAQLLADFKSLVMTDGEHGLTGLERWVRDSVRPQRLLEMLNVDIPMLRQAHVHRAGLVRALDGLAELVRTRMLEANPHPPLTSDITTGETWCEDDRTRGAAMALLESVDAGVRGGDAVAPLASAQGLLVRPLQTLAAERLLARRA